MDVCSKYWVFATRREDKSRLQTPSRTSGYGLSQRDALVAGVIGPTRGILDPWCLTAARKSRSSSHARRLHMASHQRRFGVTDVRYSQGYVFASGRLATAPQSSPRGQGHDAMISNCKMTAAGACMMGEKGSVASLWRIGFNDQQNTWN